MQKIINPATIKKNLVVASLFVTTYEILRTSIVDKPKGFLNLAQGFTLDGTEPLTYSAKYRKEIIDLVIPEISQKKGEFHDFYASCLWFQNLEAITEDDVKDIQAIRKHRNMIAHEQPIALPADYSDLLGHSGS